MTEHAHPTQRYARSIAAADANGKFYKWSSQREYRLVIADDHPLFRGALREAVTGLFEGVDIAEAGTFDEVANCSSAAVRSISSCST